MNSELYPPCGSYGDLNDDGIVDAADAQLLAQHLAGTITLSEDQLARADFYGNGSVDESNLELLNQYIVGAIDTFPVCQPVNNGFDFGGILEWLRANPVMAVAIVAGIYLLVRGR